jgi:ABC-type transporter MlaC component
LIQDSQLVKSGVLNCYMDENRANLLPMSKLWHILTSSNKQLLSSEFKEYLDKEFNDHLYEHLLKSYLSNFDYAFN